MFCKNCGQELSSSAKFCPGCGTAIEEDKLEIQSAIPEKGVDNSSSLESAENNVTDIDSSAENKPDEAEKDTVQAQPIESYSEPEQNDNEVIESANESKQSEIVKGNLGGCFMFCKKCGKELTEDTKFCPNCGEKMDFSDSGDDVSASEENISTVNSYSDTSNGITSTNEVLKNNRNLKKPIIIAIVLVIVFLVIHGISNSDSDSKGSKRGGVSGTYYLDLEIEGSELSGKVKLVKDYDEDHYKISYSGANIFGVPSDNIEIEDEWFIYEKTMNGEKWFHVPQSDMDDYYWVISEDGSTLRYGYYQFSKK